MAISGKVGAVYTQTSAAPATFTDEVVTPYGNLLTKNQSSAETDTAGFTTMWSSLLTRDVTQCYVGNASVKVTAAGGTGRLGAEISGGVNAVPAKQGQVFTGSLYVKAAGNLVGKQGYIAVKENTAPFTSTAQSFFFTDTWQRISVTHTVVQADTARVVIAVSDVGSQGVVDGDYFYTDGLQIEFGNQLTPWSEGVGYTKFKISDTTKRYWDISQAVTVKKNTVIQTTGFKLEHVGGITVFDTPLVSTDIVTVSGNNFTVAQSGGFFNWSLDGGADTSEVTTFQSNGWKEHQATLKEWSASAEAYWGNNDFFTKLGTECVVVLYLDTVANLRFEGYGIIAGDGIEVNNEDIVNESVDIQGNRNLYLRER